jgi:hypothetical protein
MTIWIWGAALVAYLVFLGWYVNWRGPIAKGEVEGLISAIRAANPEAEARNEMGHLRGFLEADDGREFFMLNLVRIAPGEVADPATGQLKPARQVMEGYTRMFLPALFARGGHPAIAARKVGPYFGAWGVEVDPGWTIMGYMRYRSRRDLAILVADPRFGGAHDFKFAAMPQTYSFPTQPQIMTLAGPRIWVGLVLALAAALAQIAALVGHGGAIL